MAAVVLHLSYPLAFVAGLVSFLSPCVFPLVPAYLAYLGGRAGEPALVAAGPGAALAHGPERREVPLVANGVAFVLGFSVVFTALFYVFTALDIGLFVEHRRAVNLVAGAVVVVLALQTLGVIRIGALMRDRRVHLLPTSAGLVPSFLLGVTFAAGWTPCIGPQLSLILTVASDRNFTGLPVMLTYCAGLAVPFLVVAVLTDRLQGVIRAVNRRLGVINLVAGALLLVFGLMLMTDRLTVLSGLSAQSPFDL